MGSWLRPILGYVGAFLALTFPYWLQGEVIVPSRQHVELAAPAPVSNGRIENRKFGDDTRSHIPEVASHLHEPRSGWLATWTNGNGLGRPLYHVSGFSAAYPPAMLLAQMTGSEERYLTALALATCFLAGLFLLLACRELGHSPEAALLAAGSLAASPLFMYWLTFPMFPAVWCWSAGALWGIARLWRIGDLAGWAVLAFSTYSVLMTAYPQPTVYHGYILAGFALHLAWRRWRAGGGKAAGRLGLGIASAVLVGGALAAPVYADVAHTLAQSARAAPDPSFFLAALPRVESLDAALRLLALSTFPELFGNPVSQGFPFPYDGLSLTALVLCLALVALVLRWRETWGWWLAACTLLALGLIHPLYRFGVEHLGFHLSRSTPLGSMMLPLTMIAAHGADALLQRDPRVSPTHAIALAIAGVLLVLGIAVSYGASHGATVRWAIIAVVLTICVLFAAQAARPRPLLLFGALALTGLYASFPLMLRQPPSDIVRTSPLVEALRRDLAADSRYAVAAPGIGVLPPNVNAGLGLPSVHGYNSLSPRSYHAHIQALGGETLNYGRWNEMIAPDYGGTPFWMSDVSVVLSPAAIAHPNLEIVAKVGDVHVHRVRERMGCCIQVAGEADIASLWAGGPGAAPFERARKLSATADRFDVVVRGGAESLLVLSQAFHRDWRASALSASGWTEARTLPVAGFFQGVVVPAGSSTVRLEFEPLARLAWIAHGFWAAMLVVFALRAWRGRASFRR